MKKTEFNISTTTEFRNSVHLNTKYHSDKNISIYLKIGWLKFEVNGKVYEIEPESVFIINRGSVFVLKAFSDEFRLRQLEADASFASKLRLNFSKYDAYRTLQLRDSSLRLDETTFTLVWQQIGAISHYLKKSSKNDFQERILGNLYIGLIYMVLSVLFEKSNKTLVFNDRKESITMNFLELVEQDFKIDRSLGYYSKKLHLSSKYVSNCVREITGMSPTDFIAKTTIGFARGQLIYTSITIAELADQLHFSDAYSFGKFFKKHSGYSPGKFRKLMS